MKASEFAKEYLARCSEPGAKVVIGDCIEEITRLTQALQESEQKRQEAEEKHAALMKTPADWEAALVQQVADREAHLSTLEAQLRETEELCSKAEERSNIRGVKLTELEAQNAGMAEALREIAEFQADDSLYEEPHSQIAIFSKVLARLILATLPARTTQILAVLAAAKEVYTDHREQATEVHLGESDCVCAVCESYRALEEKP